MGNSTDPIYVKVSTHTQSPDGTTRNDVFYMTSTLNAYSVQLANNIATPVYKSVIAEQAASGFLGSGQQYVSDSYLGTAAGGPVSLRAEVGVGFKALATPVRYALVRYDNIATPISANQTVGGQFIYNWIDSLLQQLTPFYLYQGIQVP